MTDWNKESDLILEWLKYRIDWTAKHLEYYSPMAILRILRKTGVMFINRNKYDCLTFEEWKQLNQP